MSRVSRTFIFFIGIALALTNITLLFFVKAPKKEVYAETEETLVNSSSFGDLYRVDGSFTGVDTLLIGDNLQYLDIYFTLPDENTFLHNYLTVTTDNADILSQISIIGYDDNYYIFRFAKTGNSQALNLIIAGGNYHYRFNLSEPVDVVTISGSINVYKSDFFEQFNSIVFNVFNNTFLVIGNGFNYLANNLFLNNGSLSNFTIILAVFFGLSLALSICKYVLVFVTTLGRRKKKKEEL